MKLLGEKKKSTEKVLRQIRKDPKVEKEISKVIFETLRKYEIAVKDDEILILEPVVLDRPQTIIDALRPCRLGICPPDWLRIKADILDIFNVGRIDEFRKIISPRQSA